MANKLGLKPLTVAAIGAGLLAVGSLSTQPAEAASLDVGTHNRTVSGATRGYWFTAPTDFTITGLRAALESGPGDQSIEVLKLNAPPPLFSSVTSGTNDFVSLGYWNNVSGPGFISTNIAVQVGDIIGVLGSRGPSASNSYPLLTGLFTSSFFGLPVTLNRFGFQGNLANQQASDVWTEFGEIGRVEMEYTATAIPTPALLPGLLGLSIGVLRKRKGKAAEAEADA